jgi:hypothetical protein
MARSYLHCAQVWPLVGAPGQKPAAAPGQFDFPKNWPALWMRAVYSVQSIPEPW